MSPPCESDLGDLPFAPEESAALVRVVERFADDVRAGGVPEKVYVGGTSCPLPYGERCGASGNKLDGGLRRVGAVLEIVERRGRARPVEGYHEAAEAFRPEIGLQAPVPLHDDVLAVVVAVYEHEDIASGINPAVRHPVRPIADFLEPLVNVNSVIGIGVAMLRHFQIPGRAGFALEASVANPAGAYHVRVIDQLLRNFGCCCLRCRIRHRLYARRMGILFRSPGNKQSRKGSGSRLGDRRRAAR